METNIQGLGGTGAYTTDNDAFRTAMRVAATGSDTQPFVCTTREQATILIRETSGTNTQSGGFLTLTGHW